jgi:hypothetical protein
MRRTLALIATAAFALSLAGAADAQKIDSAGHCHAKDGKLAKMEVCKSLKPAAATAGYKKDAKGACHGPDGKMAKKEMCK